MQPSYRLSALVGILAGLSVAATTQEILNKSFVSASNALRVTIVSGSVLGAPGSDTQVLYNDGGNIGADSGLTFNETTNVLTAHGGITLGNATTSLLSNDGTNGVTQLGADATTATAQQIKSHDIASATDVDAPTLTLSTGQSRGTGLGTVDIAVAPVGSTGTGANTPVTGLQVSGLANSRSLVALGGTNGAVNTVSYDSTNRRFSFEGATADVIETTVTANPTVGDQNWTIPDAAAGVSRTFASIESNATLNATRFDSGASTGETVTTAALCQDATCANTCVLVFVGGILDSHTACN